MDIENVKPIDLIAKYIDEKYGDDAYQDDDVIAVQLDKKRKRFMSISYHNEHIVLIPFPEVLEIRHVDFADPKLFDIIDEYAEAVLKG